MGPNDPPIAVWFERQEVRVQSVQFPQLAHHVVVFVYLIGGRVERVCADEVAEEVGGGEFGGRVETLEDEFVVFELGCFEESMV